MDEDLTSWWVNGYNSTYRGIRDFLITQKTLKSRISLFSDDEKVKKTALNGKQPSKNIELDKASRDKRDKQAKEDREKFLTTLFDANDHEGIAKAATRHN